MNLLEATNKVRKELSETDTMIALLEVIDYKGADIDFNDITDACDINEILDYDGSIHEKVDGLIDIYYHDLRKWSVDNYSYIEDAIEEGLCEGVTDFHKLIQMGQYVYYREQMSESINELYDAIITE